MNEPEKIEFLAAEVRGRLLELDEEEPPRGSDYERGELRGRREALEEVLEVVDELRDDDGDEGAAGLVERFLAWLASDRDDEHTHAVASSGDEGGLERLKELGHEEGTFTPERSDMSIEESADDVSDSILGDDGGRP